MTGPDQLGVELTLGLGVRGESPAELLEIAGQKRVASFERALAKGFEQHGGDFAGALEFFDDMRWTWLELWLRPR